MIDDRTEHFDLPLPHRDNELGVDVERLRNALTTVDAALESLGEGEAPVVELPVIVLESVELMPTTDGQTAFTVTGGYTAGSFMVFLNGVKLASDDFTATASPALTLAAGVALGSTVEVVRLKLVAA